MPTSFFALLGVGVGDEVCESFSESSDFFFLAKEKGRSKVVLGVFYKRSPKTLVNQECE